MGKKQQKPPEKPALNPAALTLAQAAKILTKAGGKAVSEKMLAQTLRTLETDGLVARDAKPVVPPYVEYSLTPLGTELAQRLLPLMDWIVDHAPAIVDQAG